jgi:hypothetical protein
VKMRNEDYLDKIFHIYLIFIFLKNYISNYTLILPRNTTHTTGYVVKDLLNGTNYLKSCSLFFTFYAIFVSEDMKAAWLEE